MPYSQRGKPIQTVASDRDFCLGIKDGELQLKQSHKIKYYHQVQTQIFTCDVEYCDFVVGAFCTDGDAIFVDKILHDESF